MSHIALPQPRLFAPLMDLTQLFGLFVASRILHVLTAVVLVGGMFFIRFLLMPTAAATLGDQEHQSLRSALMKRWKMFVHGGIALFLLTGFFNYLRVIQDGSHKGDGLYHGLVGTKIILALVTFFISSALVGRSAAFEKLRQNAKLWLTVNLLLAVVIIAISGFLRVRGIPAAKPATTETGTTFLSAPLSLGDLSQIQIG